MGVLTSCLCKQIRHRNPCKTSRSACRQCLCPAILKAWIHHTITTHLHTQHTCATMTQLLDQ
jgi:hypothetical protein